MCGGNEDIVISTGGGCGLSSQTIRISRNQSCGLGSNGYIITEQTGSGCGSSTASYQVDESTGRSIIDEINYRRENENKTLRRR